MQKSSLNLSSSPCLAHVHSVADTPRSIKAPTATAEQFFQKLRNKHEFTVLATLKQAPLNSGVILSIHHLDHRYVYLVLRIH